MYAKMYYSIFALCYFFIQQGYVLLWHFKFYMHRFVFPFPFEQKEQSHCETVIFLTLACIKLGFQILFPSNGVVHLCWTNSNGGGSGSHFKSFVFLNKESTFCENKIFFINHSNGIGTSTVAVVNVIYFSMKWRKCHILVVTVFLFIFMINFTIRKTHNKMLLNLLHLAISSPLMFLNVSKQMFAIYIELT